MNKVEEIFCVKHNTKRIDYICSEKGCTYFLMCHQCTLEDLSHANIHKNFLISFEEFNKICPRIQLKMEEKSIKIKEIMEKFKKMLKMNLNEIFEKLNETMDLFFLEQFDKVDKIFKYYFFKYDYILKDEGTEIDLKKEMFLELYKTNPNSMENNLYNIIENSSNELYEKSNNFCLNNKMKQYFLPEFQNYLNNFSLENYFYDLDYSPKNQNSLNSSDKNKIENISSLNFPKKNNPPSLNFNSKINDFFGKVTIKKKIEIDNISLINDDGAIISHGTSFKKNFVAVCFKNKAIKVKK